MTKTIKFIIDNGCASKLLVTLPETAESPARKGLRETSKMLEVTANLDEALELIKKVTSKAAKAYEMLKEAAPDELTTSMALSFDVEAGCWAFAKASAGVEIEFSFSWKKSQCDA